jgi:hypothetical protein
MSIQDLGYASPDKLEQAAFDAENKTNTKPLDRMTVAEAAASGQTDAYNKLVAGYGVAKPVDTNKPMTTQEMSSSGTLSPQTKPTTPSTTNLGGAVDSTIANVNAGLSTTETETDPAKKVRESMDAYLGTEGKEEITAAKQEEIVKKQAALKIQNELTKMDKDYRDEVNEIKKNRQGTFGGAMQQEINRATDRYNNNRANVSIAYNTALGDYQAAQETVNLKTQSYNDMKKNQYAEWEMNYKMATDFATPEQKLALEAKSAQMKADISLMTDAKKTVMDNLLQNNAPQSVWNAVDEAASKEGATASDIMAAAGSYGIDKYKQAQTAKALSDLQGGSGGTSDLMTQLLTGGLSKEDGTTALSMLVANGSLTPSAAKFIGENTGIMQTSAQKVADGKLSAMTNNVTQLFNALENVPVGASALGSTLESWIPFREASEGANAVKVYNSLRDAFTGPVARIISQEVGVLTDKDVKRAQDILPAVGDNADVRATKITNIKQAIDNIKGGAPLSSEAQEWYRENVLTPAGMTDLTGLDFTL